MSQYGFYRDMQDNVQQVNGHVKNIVDRITNGKTTEADAESFQDFLDKLDRKSVV